MNKPKRTFFAVVATRQDWTETIVAIYRNPAKAYEANRLHAQADTKHKFIRLRVKPVSLDADDVAALVKSWGVADAKEGIENPGLTDLPEPYRSHYLAGFNSVRRPS
jgi:hypothetical protein